jgi:hypothetical protein
VLDRASAVGAAKPYLPEVMSPNNEFGPVVLLEHERRLVFASDREGGKGKLDLWFYWLYKQQAPQQMPGVNTADNDAYWTSLPEAEQAYFASDRGGSHYDIYRLSPAYGGSGPVIERVNRARITGGRHRAAPFRARGKRRIRARLAESWEEAQGRAEGDPNVSPLRFESRRQGLRSLLLAARRRTLDRRRGRCP